MYHIHCTCISPQRLQLNAILVTSGLTLLTLTTVPRMATNLPRMVTKIKRESQLYLVNCLRIGQICTMMSFYYFKLNPLEFWHFLVQIRAAFVI